MNSRRLGVIFILLFTTIILAGLDWSISTASPRAQRPFPPPGDPGEGKESALYPGRGDRQRPPSQTTGHFRSPVNTVDQFGYLLDDSVPFSWIDATSGTAAAFATGDDSFIGPVDLGFDFLYYENVYNQLYISTNGTLNFTAGNASFDNQPMPQSSPPDNLIAPFWDDLTVGDLYNTGNVYYTTGGIPPDRYFVVEWHKVTHFGSSDLLTFEAILHENGDIQFQYLDINGVADEASVGIEDADGVDGLTYVHNVAGITPGMALRFARPPAEARVKFLSTYESELTERRETAYQLLLRNTGEVGSDTYNLVTSSSNPDWQVSLYRGATPLGDTDGDGRLDTGPINQGSTFTLTVDLEAGLSESVGDFTEVTVTAISAANPGKQSTTSIDAAIPASFGQAFTDNQMGRGLEFIWESHHSLPSLPSSPSSSLALEATPGGNYVYAWEKSGLNGTTFFSNIEYLMLNSYGFVVREISLIQDNGAASMQTTDRMPGLAAAPDGHIGLIWVQERFNTATFESNSNVYFAVLDPAGTPSFGPLNVTQNAGWLGEGDLGIPSFTSPSITATDDDHFLLAWIDGRQQTDGESRDIAYAVYDTSGNQVQPVQIFAQSVAGGVRYLDPALTSLSGARAYLTYSVFDPLTFTYMIAFAVLDSNGTTLVPETALSVNNGWGPDALQLGANKLFTAWTNPTTNEITFAILNSDNLSALSGPTSLDNPDTRPADFVSITTDPAGRAILTWMDAKWNSALYYALIGGDGQVITPAMVFRAGQGENPLIKTGFSGQGNAMYVGSWQVFLPVAQR